MPNAACVYNCLQKAKIRPRPQNAETQYYSQSKPVIDVVLYTILWKKGVHNQQENEISVWEYFGQSNLCQLNVKLCIIVPLVFAKSRHWMFPLVNTSCTRKTPESVIFGIRKPMQLAFGTGLLALPGVSQLQQTNVASGHGQSVQSLAYTIRKLCDNLIVRIQLSRADHDCSSKIMRRDKRNRRRYQNVRFSCSQDSIGLKKSEEQDHAC